MERREFMRQTLAATASTWLSGCGREPSASVEEQAVGDARAPAPLEDPHEPAPAPGGGELDGEFPEWTLGDDSASPNTVLMFRGNPTHTFYGTGPLSTQPQVLWRKQLGSYAGTRPDGTTFRWAGTGWTGQAIRWGARVYFGSVDTKFYCLDAQTGEQRWVFEGAGMYKSSCCLYRGRIYVGNVDNYVRCLDARDGRLLWKYDTGRDCDSSPCVALGRLYIGGEDGRLKCLDPEDGKLTWVLDLGEGYLSKPGSGGIESSPAVADGEVYVGHYDGHLVCADAKTGERRWRARTDGDTDTSPVVVGDLVYAAAQTGKRSPYLRAFDRSKSGAKVWEFGCWRGFWSTPAVAEGRVYIGGHDGVMVCLAADSGDVLWTFAAQASIWCSPVVVDGKVLFGSHDPFLYMLDAKDGALIWKYEIGGRVHSTPCVVEGKIHVGSTNGEFYCFG
jgi:outer membrane protein assembly factor BamB